MDLEILEDEKKSDYKTQRLFLFIKARISLQKMILLLIYAILTTSVFLLTYLTPTENYQHFNLLSILKGIIFLLWILYGAFILDIYNALKFTKVIMYFFSFIIITAIIFQFTKTDIIFIPLIMNSVLIIILGFIQKNSEKKILKEYLNIFKENKETNVVLVTFIFLSIVLQIIWCFSNPDATGYYLTATNILENLNTEINEPLIGISPAFIRKLFFKVSDSSMKIQYPIGALYILALFIKFGSYWRTLFILISIVFSIEIISLYANINKKYPSWYNTLVFLFISQTLIQITTGIGFDFVAIGLSFFTLNIIFKILEQNKKLEIFNLVLFTVVIALVKTSVFIFHLFTAILLVFYIFITSKELKEKFIAFSKKYRVLIITLGVIILVCAIALIYVSIAGYLNQFSIVNKLIRPFREPIFTFTNFGINLIQIIFVYLPIIITLISSKKIIANCSEEEKEKLKPKRIILTSAFVFSLVFVFFWNSSNIYPFDIGSRYVMLLGIFIAMFSNLDKFNRKIKTTFIVYIAVTNSVILIHAAGLDYVNNYFADKVEENIADDAIIISNYYAKLFPNRTTYIPGLFYSGSLQNTTEDIMYLLLNNYTLYYIPDCEPNYNTVITGNFTLYKIFSYLPGGIFKIFPSIGGYDLINPYPRELYKLEF